MELDKHAQAEREREARRPKKKKRVQQELAVLLSPSASLFSCPVPLQSTLFVSTVQTLPLHPYSFAYLQSS